MFFELHDERIIGYKRLSQADLGTSPTSHQTHIGLSETVLTFLGDRDEVGEDSIFIYNGGFDFIDAHFDRIANQDGTFRSPKIRKGDKNAVSIVNAIRDNINSGKSSLSWFLFWFGLKNGKLVFFLFNNDSDDYKAITSFGLDLNKTGTKSIDTSFEKFSDIATYIENKVNENAEDELKELEIITQIEVVRPSKKYRAYDIEKANKFNAEIGKKGEELVDRYLNHQLELGKIKSYNWSNADKETGRPYDFSYQDLSDNVIYLDVKTTGYDFNQKMIFSSQEIEFIANTQNPYCIYRVYKNENDEYMLRICDNSKKMSEKVNAETVKYSDKLAELNVGFRGAKIAIGADIYDLMFKESVLL